MSAGFSSSPRDPDPRHDDGLLHTLFSVRREERRPLLLAFVYFFCVLASYYVLRPIRDAMGVAGGVGNLFSAGGQAVLAGGTAAPDDKRISVEARRGDTRFGICSTTFLEEAFRTDYYRIDITFNDDGSWTYVTRTDLAVRGSEPPFNHHDTNTLRRIGPPTPNPLVGQPKG